MSAAIQQMVLRKRAAQAQAEAARLHHDAIVAQARGEPGPAGKDGRGIAKLAIENGDLIVTYTDKKKQNAGKVVSERVVVVGGASAAPTASAPATEETAMYAKRVDFIDDNLFYKGEAQPGTGNGTAAWRIVRITTGIDGDVTEEWAEGSAEFVHVWNERLTYAYL